LHLNHNMELTLKNVMVVKDVQRHVVRLVSDQYVITLMKFRTRHKARAIKAYSGKLGLVSTGLLGDIPIDPKTGEPNLPRFIVRLLS